MPAASIRIEGLDQVMARLRADKIAQTHLRQGFARVGKLLETEAGKRAPVNKGNLKNSIASQVDPSDVPLWVKVGHIRDSSAPYAPYMEYGTGMVHDHPSWPRKPHKIPVGALDGWAHRKGIDGGDGNGVRMAIMRRGGLMPRRYLRGALEANSDQVINIIAGALRRAGET